MHLPDFIKEVSLLLTTVKTKLTLNAFMKNSLTNGAITEEEELERLHNPERLGRDREKPCFLSITGLLHSGAHSSPSCLYKTRTKSRQATS